MRQKSRASGENADSALSPIRPRRARSYALLGAALSQGAPLGALGLHALTNGSPLLAHLSANAFLYAYMSVSTCIAFSIFGYRLGSVADALLKQRGALRKANHRLKRVSQVDSLTRVLNRRSVNARLLSEFTRSERDGSSLAILMLDLDHFKRINDERGHMAGDRVLRRVGRHLRRMARSTDSVGRIGGEEFLVVLPATETADAVSIAERLRSAIGSAPLSEATPSVTASIGVAVVTGADRRRLEQILRLLDQALYRAKDEGRNRVCLSETSPG